MKTLVEVLVQGLITLVMVGAILMSFGFEKKDFYTLLSGKLPLKESAQAPVAPQKRISGSQTPDEPAAAPPSPVLTQSAKPLASVAAVLPGTSVTKTMILTHKTDPASKIAGETTTSAKKIKKK